MKTMLTSALALVAALAFGGANLTASAESVSTTSPHHAQEQMTPDASGKAEPSGKRAKAKAKKAKKAKKAGKTRGKGMPGEAGGKGKGATMPPGLAKRDALPPGLEKHVERHGTLPPGLAKRDLPADLEDLLPRRRKGLVRKIVGEDVVLLEEATGLVLDVLEGVLAK